MEKCFSYLLIIFYYTSKVHVHVNRMILLINFSNSKVLNYFILKFENMFNKLNKLY